MLRKEESLYRVVVLFELLEPKALPAFILITLLSF